MAAYDIELIAQLSGVTTTTLRAWQRYGLLRPERTPDGHRLYQEADLMLIHNIRQWVEQGIPVNKLKPMLDGNLSAVMDEWEPQGDAIHALLVQGQPARLRQLVWRYGREYPAASYIRDIIRPLRRRLKVSQSPLAVQQLSMLDSALTEYATFVLNSTRKKPGAPVMLVTWQSSDITDVWLEAIRLANEGLRLEVLISPIPFPVLCGYQAEHVLLWSDIRLSGAQQQQYDGWLAEGIPVMLIGPGAVKSRMMQRVESPQTEGLDLDDVAELD